MLSSPWHCSNLKRTRCRIWRRRNIWSWGMAILPLWRYSKWRTKRRNQWRNNSRHDINVEKEGFVSCSDFRFLAPFSPLFYTPELDCRLKSNNLGNEQYILLPGLFNPSTSGIQSCQKNATLIIGYHYTNSLSLGMICKNWLMKPT